MLPNFSVDFIKALAYSEKEYNLGIELFENYGTYEMNESFVDDLKCFDIKVEEFDDCIYDVELKVNLYGNLTHYSCNCGKTGCKHYVCAVMNFVRDKKSGVQISKVQNAKKLLAETFINQFCDSIKSDDDKVKIFPYINFSDNSIMFKVGRKRSYLIKNINEFLYNVENNEYFVYGSSLEFRHNKNAFSNIANKYIDLIYGEVEGLDLKKDQVKRLTLKKVNVDRFFELFLNTKIFVADKSENIEKYSIGRCCTDETPIVFNVSYKDNVATIERPVYNFKYIAGVDYSYIFMNNILYRIPKLKGEIINVLYKTFNIMKTETITYSTNELDEFLSYIYPLLYSYELLSEDSSIDGFDLNKPKIEMYMDSVNGDVVARVQNTFSENKGYRDRLLESKIKTILSDYGFVKSGETKQEEITKNEENFTVLNNNYKLRGDENIYNFFMSNMRDLRDIVDVYCTDTFTNFNKTVKFTYPQFDFKLTNEEVFGIKLLDITIKNNNFDLSELKDILNSFKRKKKFHKLKDNSIISLENNNISDALEFIFSLDSEGEFNFSETNNVITAPVYRGINVHGIDASYNNEFLELVNKIKNYKSISEQNEYNHINATLRDYQKEGVTWLKILYENGLGGILADEMGLGKTVQAIGLMTTMKKPKVLCVVPASLVYNWQKEINKFSDLSVVTINESKENRILKLKVDANVYITTYDTLRRDIDLYEDMHFDILIADEAQNIKNFEIMTAKVIRKINRKTTFALTGTPIENSLKELWAIFDFIMPGYLYKYKTFQEKVMKSVYEGDENTIEVLRRQISPFVLRRFKSDVLDDLPEKIEQVVYCKMSQEQEKIYTANYLDAIGEIKEEGVSKSNLNIISKITKLRQITNSPNLVVDVDREIESGKISAVLDLIENVLENGHRPLIFSQFTSMLELVIEKLKEREISYLYLNGSTKHKERYNMTSTFNSGEGDVFLISLKAGGVGLNLVGADTVIHIEPWWNPSVINQATDRAHRIGQKEVVQVFKLITENTIEEKILQLCDKKQHLVDKVMTNDPSELKGITNKELLELFDV